VHQVSPQDLARGGGGGEGGGRGHGHGFGCFSVTVRQLEIEPHSQGVYQTRTTYVTIGRLQLGANIRVESRVAPYTPPTDQAQLCCCPGSAALSAINRRCGRCMPDALQVLCCIAPGPLPATSSGQCACRVSHGLPGSYKDQAQHCAERHWSEWCVWRRTEARGHCHGTGD
jgi:hypothetical protein